MMRRTFGGRLLHPSITHSRFPKIEQLENRVLPAVLVVNSPFDNSISGDGLVTLREAIAAANGNFTTDLGHTGSGQDIIRFESSVFNIPREIVLALGEIAITESLVLEGPGLTQLTINGNQSSRIFRVDDGNNSNQSTVEISGMLLTGGVTTGGGGAILSHESLILRDVLATGNRAGYGGGIRIHAHSGSATILDSAITGNFAEFEGGGLRTHTYTGAQITIRNSVISGNSAGFDGGGIGAVTYAGGELTIETSSIAGNTASFRGGGISARTYGGQLRIQSSTISGNTVSGGTDGGGGALYSRNFGTVAMQNSTFSGNLASLDGGAIYSRNYGSTVIRNSTIANNRSDSDSNGSGDGDVIRSASGTVQFENSILVGTARLLVGDVSATFSLIGTNTGTSFSEAPLGSPDANGNLIGGPIHGPIDPLLGPLSSNDGPTAVHIPLAGSPVIDAGDPGFAGPPISDQRGSPYWRVADGSVNGQRIDMGAVELQKVALGMPGDYDRDSDVDADDYLVWKLTFFSSSSLAADGNTNGIVDAADYTIWRDHAFAASGGGAVTLVANSESTNGTTDVIGREAGSRQALQFVSNLARLFHFSFEAKAWLPRDFSNPASSRSEWDRNASHLLLVKGLESQIAAREAALDQILQCDEPTWRKHPLRSPEWRKIGVSETDGPDQPDELSI